MQEQIFVHGYFGRNKGILTGFVIFSIMSGTSYMLWSFLFEQASGFAGKNQFTRYEFYKKSKSFS